MKSRILHIITAALVLALVAVPLTTAVPLTVAALLTSTPLSSARAAGSFQAVVSSGTMRVYQQKSPHKYMGSLTKGTAVTVRGYSGQAALISYNGKVGIARVSDLTPVTSAVASPADAAPSTTASPAERASAREMVTNRATRVYRRASRTSGYVSVKRGTRVGLLAVSGSVAKVINGNAIGYVPAAHLSDPAAAQPAPTPAPAANATPVEKYDRVPVLTTSTARIYAKPSTSSSYITVGRGAAMVLLAVKGNCAMIERGGRVGYVARSLLTTDVSTVPTTAPKANAKTEEIKPDEDAFSGTNEEVVFKFLTRVAGYNTAAACGIMANIKYESGYKATSGGDNGSSYGIVQWHGSRKTRLINWCRNNGYDHTTLKGQLYFLQYELKSYYPAVHNRLKAVANSDQGAYDAGYDFCYNFEAPSSRATRSVTRGNYARTTLWNRYKT